MNHQRSAFANLVPPLLAAGVVFVGCSSNDDFANLLPHDTSSTSTSSNGSGGGGAGGTGGVGDVGNGGSAADGGGGGGGSVEPPPSTTRRTASGDITWQVTFDATAQAAGEVDCSYTRHYEGVEDQSAPWLCPTCEVIFRADVQLTSGLDDCFSKVSGGTPASVEWIGYDSNGAFWRGNGAPMGALGTATTTATGVDIAHTVPNLPTQTAGVMSFGITGALSLGKADGDPMNGWATPHHYACGWPKANPPRYDGDYVLTVGETVPDGLVKDSCDEVVRLHDFQGTYLLIDMSAMNCPPCQAMATQEEQFITDMAAQGIKVQVITLLAPSLSNVVGLTTTTMLTTWINRYSLTSPVLADRAWGLSVFTPALGKDSIGYPSWVLVDPNLKVMSVESGFGDFSAISAAIVADATP